MSFSLMPTVSKLQAQKVKTEAEAAVLEMTKNKSMAADLAILAGGNNSTTPSIPLNSSGISNNLGVGQIVDSTMKKEHDLIVKHAIE